MAAVIEAAVAPRKRRRRSGKKLPVEWPPRTLSLEEQIARRWPDRVHRNGVTLYEVTPRVGDTYQSWHTTREIATIRQRKGWAARPVSPSEFKSQLVNAPDDRWMERAACRGIGPEDYYPNAPEGFQAFPDDKPEVYILLRCGRCPVRDHCLGFALKNGERNGIWGGLTPRERTTVPELEADRVKGLV